MISMQRTHQHEGLKFATHSKVPKYNASHRGTDEETVEYNDMDNIPFYESQHGRLRREQRGIDKKDLLDAMRYGKRVKAHPDRRSGNARSKYTYNGIVYVVDDVTGQEITSWASRLILKQQPLSEEDYERHLETVKVIQRTPAHWESNTVIVVDTSASMKASDVWGAKTRLSAVWISLALDFVAHRIETGASCGDKDVVSILLMGETVKVVVKEQPIDWVLYNTIIDVYNEKIPEAPKGHGYYIPTLVEAERLLDKCRNSRCSLSLHFLSDGRPSDHKAYKDTTTNDSDILPYIQNIIKNLALKFAQRLSVSTVGIGNPDDFDVLESMASVALQYGAKGCFQLPSLSTSALGAAFNTVTSSITCLSSDYEEKYYDLRELTMQDGSEMTQCVTSVDNENYKIYSCNDVIRKVYDPGVPGSFKTVPLQYHNAKGIAIRNNPFGQGAERYAFQLFELAEDYLTVVGKPSVAKDSRLLCAGSSDWEEQREKFVRTFCATQQQAQIIANAFNAKLDAMPNLDPFTARILFVNCSVYHVNDKYTGKRAFLVDEEFLDSRKFQKWNNNFGGVYGEGKKECIKIEEKDDEEFIRTFRAHSFNLQPESISCLDTYNNRRTPLIRVTPGEVAQAFSHFSYVFTNKTRLVCDLQGIYDEGLCLFKLTDPVIHYHNCLKEHNTKIYGRSDMGRKGIKAFLNSHKCNNLCRLVLQGYSIGQKIPPSRSKQQA